MEPKESTKEEKNKSAIAIFILSREAKAGGTFGELNGCSLSLSS